MADTAHDVIGEWEKAFLGGDIDALVDLYEEDAVYVVASMGIAARGRAAIRAVWEGFLAMGEPISFEADERDVTVDGDHGYAHLTGTLRVRWAESGDEEDMPIRATEVLHRGDDGRWRYVIDHA